MINLFIYENVIVIGRWDLAKLVIDFFSGFAIIKKPDFSIEDLASVVP